MTEGTLHPFGEDIWLADGPVVAVAGFRYPTRMAVMRLPSGALFLWSPIGLSDGLRGAVAALGEVRHLVAPNTLHDRFLGEWQHAFPQATLHAPPGLAARHPDLRFGRDLADSPGFAWDGQIDQVGIPGNRIATELAFFHRPSRTLLFTDLIQHLPPGWFTGWRAIVARLDGMTAPEPRVPRKFRYAFSDRPAARAAMRRVLAWPAERLVIAHGPPIAHDAHAVVARAFRWLGVQPTSACNVGNPHVLVLFDDMTRRATRTRFMTVNVKDAPYSAMGNGQADDTAAIQAALNDHHRIFIPAGIYRIDPSIGLVLRTGSQIVGEGRGATILQALPGGGSIAQLAGYGGGSIIRRAFNPNSTNDYVTDVVLRDFGVVLTHPDNGITTTQIQIGIDLRNITRSIVERVHVGNLAPENGVLTKPKTPNYAYDVQGYGMVIGNISSGVTLPGPDKQKPYAGGEVNTIRNCAVWGAYKLITQDDGDLCPLSAAHATTIDTCDLQAGHHILVQESPYATGNAWRGNTLQAVVKQAGNANSSFLLRVEGYNNQLADGYIEGQDWTGNVPQLDYLLYLGTSSHNNRIALPYFAYASLAAQMVDNGRRNIVTGYEAEPQFTDHDDDPATPPVETSKASFGPAFTLYDGAHAEPWVKFHWDGTQVVIDGGQGASVIRVGVGDYLVNWDKPFRSDDYALSASLNTNSSGHPGSITLGSQTEANARFYTYIDAGGPLAQADPQFLYVSAKNG